MSWVAPAVLALQILLLVYVTAIDVATRIIPNVVSFTLALLGVAGQAMNPDRAVQSLVGAAILFLLLFIAYARRWMGGGDVKLFVALAVGLPLAGISTFLAATALAGAGLVVIHLAMRSLPEPVPAPQNASLLRRVYAIERWRNRRRAPLPYGAAIAFGGIWTLLNLGH
jgi:prepilin peptidase CpaA